MALYNRAPLIMWTGVVALVVMVYQGCGPGFLVSENPSGSSTGGLSASMNDRFGAASMSLSPTEDLVVGNGYDVVISQVGGSRALAGPPAWEIQSTPADVCFLSDPGRDPYVRHLTCVDEASIVLSGRLSFSQGGGSQEEVVVIRRDVKAAPALKVRGGELYQLQCAACHGQLNDTLKPNRTAMAIRDSIFEVPSMTAIDSLRLLSSTELRAISLALVKTDSSDIVAPSVQIASPSHKSTVAGSLTVEVAASDDVGVAGVKLKIDGQEYGAELTSPPFRFTMDTAALSESTHIFSAVARDAGMNESTAAVVVAVDNIKDADMTAPVAIIAAPANSSVATGTVQIQVNASDDVGVVGVKLEVDGMPYGTEDTEAPYSLPFNSTTFANGSTHTIVAKARDAAGNIGASAAISVRVDNPAMDTTAPTIAIVAPAAGSQVSGLVQIMVNASDNVGVAGVQLKVNGANSGAEVMVSPFTLPWNTSLIADGTYTITAVARDAAGNMTTSAARTYTVNNSVLVGANLYITNCASCHGDLATSEKRNRTATQITNAIANVNAMRNRANLRALSAAEIAAIAAALKD